MVNYGLKVNHEWCVGIGTRPCQSLVYSNHGHTWQNAIQTWSIGVSMRIPVQKVLVQLVPDGVRCRRLQVIRRVCE
jgi:hypothetical protein